MKIRAAVLDAPQTPFRIEMLDLDRIDQVYEEMLRGETGRGVITF